MDVVDETAHVLARDERAALDARDRLTHVLLEVRERSSVVLMMVTSAFVGGWRDTGQLHKLDKLSGKYDRREKCGGIMALETMAIATNTSGSPARRRARAGLFSFPDPVNEVSARLLAGGVVLLCLAAIALDAPWLTATIAYGFLARVLSGPTLSPLGQLVTRVVTPRLRVAARPVPGPPKRFAQAIGAVFSVSAAVLALGLGLSTAADVLLGFLVLAATLESAFGLCLGCRAFAVLMRLGVIPAEVCERCNNIAAGPAQTRSGEPARIEINSAN
jgi:hypothetical protein